MSKEEIKSTLKKFLIKRFELSFGDPELDDDTHLYEKGYIDSIDSLVLLTFLEKTFKIKIDAQDLIDFPINTVNEMVEFISARS